MHATQKLAPVNAGENPAVTAEKLNTFAEKLGFDVRDIGTLIEAAGLAAVLRQIEAGGEFTVPLKLCVVPAGKLPVFIDERTVRFMRECCVIADVDADEWVEEMVFNEVDSSLNGKYDVKTSGIAYDLVDEHGPVEQDNERTDEEKAELYEKMREVAFRYQQELKVEQEASASVEKEDA